MKPQVADLVRPFPKALTSEGNNSPDNKEGKVWIPSCTENTKRQAVTRAAQRNIVELKGKEIRLIRLYLKTLVMFYISLPKALLQANTFYVGWDKELNLVTKICF